MILDTQELYSIKGYTKSKLLEFLLIVYLMKSLCENDITSKIELSGPSLELF